MSYLIPRSPRSRKRKDFTGKYGGMETQKIVAQHHNLIMRLLKRGSRGLGMQGIGVELQGLPKNSKEFSLRIGLEEGGTKTRIRLAES